MQNDLGLNVFSERMSSYKIAISCQINILLVASSIYYYVLIIINSSSIEKDVRSSGIRFKLKYKS